MEDTAAVRGSSVMNEQVEEKHLTPHSAYPFILSSSTRKASVVGGNKLLHR